MNSNRPAYNGSLLLRHLLVLSLTVVPLFAAGCDDAGETLRRSLRQAADRTGGKKNKDNSKDSENPGRQSQNQRADIPGFRCPEGTTPSGEAPPKGLAVACEKIDKDGKPVKHGPMLRWHRGGQISTSGNYRDGMRDGLYETFFRNGSPQEQRNYSNGKLQGPMIRFSENGQKLSEYTYYQGQRRGRYTKWSRNGQPLEEGTFFNNAKHGTVKQSYRSGIQRSITEFINGKKHGKFKEFSENGQIKTVGGFKADKPHGRWQTYARTGQVRSVGQYQDGKKEGLWIEYDRFGQIERSQQYKDNRVVSAGKNQTVQPTKKSSGWQPL